MPEAGETDPDASDASSRIPDFCKGILDVAAGQILIEAGLLRQHLHDRLLQFRRQAFDPATAPRLANSGARLSCRVAALSAAAATATRSSGVRTLRAGAATAEGFAAASAIAPGASVTVSPDAAADRALPDHREPDTVLRLRYRQLQGLAGLQRNFRQHVDRNAGDRNPHQIVGENLQHLRVDHASRLQHEIGRRALGGNHRKDRGDGNRHVTGSLG